MREPVLVQLPRDFCAETSRFCVATSRDRKRGSARLCLRIPALVLATLTLLPALRASAQTPTPEAKTSALVKPAAPRSELAKRWQERREALGQGDLAAARAALSTVDQLRLDLGIDSLEAYALNLLREARVALRRDHARRAIELTEKAEQLAPGLPDVYFTRARAHFANDTFALGSIFGSLFDGVGKFFDHPRHRTAYLINALIVLGLGLLAAVLAFFLLQAIRHVPFLLHDITDLLGIGKTLSGAILALLLILPLIFGLAPIGLIFLWSLVFWFYQNRSERIVTLSALAFTAAAPLIVMAMAPMFAFQSQPGIDLLRLASGEASPTVMRRAEARLRRRPHDFVLLFHLASLQKKRGNDEEAKRYFERARALNDRHPELLNNHANFLLATGKISEAKELYERAASLAPRLAVIHYNLSQAYRMEAAKGGSEHLERHSKALQTARRLDQKAMQKWRARESSNRNRYVIDAPLPRKVLRAYAVGALGPLPILRAQLWERIADWLPYRIAPWVSMGFMFVLGVLWFLFKSPMVAFSCARCGSTACAHCYPEVSAGNLCVQCHHIYVAGATIDPKLRLEKEAQTHRHQTRRRRLRVAFSAILMGAGQVLAGRPARGFVLLSLFFLLLLEAFFWNGIVRYPVGISAGVALGKILLIGLIFLPAYLVGLAGVLKR